MLPAGCGVHGSRRVEGVRLVAPCCTVYRYDGCVEQGGCDAVVDCGGELVAIEVKRGTLSPSDLSKALAQLERCRVRLGGHVCLVVAYERPGVAALLRGPHRPRGVLLVRLEPGRGERRLEASRLLRLCRGQGQQAC